MAAANDSGSIDDELQRAWTDVAHAMAKAIYLLYPEVLVGPLCEAPMTAATVRIDMRAIDRSQFVTSMSQWLWAEIKAHRLRAGDHAA